MPPKKKFPYSIIRFKGVINYDGLFKVIRQWFVDAGYEFHQTALKHKIPSPAGAEQEVKLNGWRKINEYTKFDIALFFKIYDIRDVEVVKEGKKQKLKHIRMNLEITPSVELDYSKRFGGSRFLQYLHEFYMKYIVKEEISTIAEDQLWYIALKLHNTIKEYLDFEAKTNAYEGVW
jgi:hypothetical protein